MGKQSTTTTTIFAAIQWLGFMFANTVVIPLSVGAAFHMSPVALSGAMARSFMITGIACLIQGMIGHRLPLMEGQSGLWWGVLLNLAATGSAAGLGISEIGGSVAVGMILGGLALMLAGAFGLHKFLNRLFTPIVMAVLLLLLAAQLIDIFFEGMMGLNQGHIILPKVALLSLLLVVLVSYLTIGVRGVVSNFSILIGLALGWVVYDVWIGGTSSVALPEWSEITRLFAWGKPAYSAGILIACVITALINTTNTIATLRAAEPVFDVQINDSIYRRSLLFSGAFTVISGPLSLVAYAPYTSSIGFLRTTRILARAPFLLGAALFVVLGAVPHLAAWFATLPVSVGDSVLFVAYLQLFGSALQNIRGIEFNFRTIFRLAPAVLTGLAVLATPKAAFSSLPPIAQSILGNGMLDGIILATVLEAVIPWERLNQA
ncbi:uracil/xanthine transporter [Alicyclobacillus ferrooxydans]|uniref:Uracil/xanthine transporter n=1 Tax=Alicyclobacillus ferrooxydans TaxID=471514 RepID=A0A0P9CAY7_9BACL|nr:uracil/xanthine transporter [Alicyclobacillus ferrooxydans]KPV42598.1 hypothetical protein AN477_16560 [Alicyclobacillus ferrooxydans]